MAPVINEYFPGLEKVPWMKLGDFPSRVEKLEEMGRAHGFKELYIKRDDCCHSEYGGNKVRKLEYVLGDAQLKGRRLLITLGASGSNQVLATGIHGGGLGFQVMGIMMDQPNAEYVRRNLLLDHRYGVEVKYYSGAVGEILGLAWNYAKAWLSGRKPYMVSAGASSPRGNLGFVNAVYELKHQVDAGDLPEPDYIVAAAGSLGTTAGLDLGCRLLGMKTKVVGVRVAMPWMVSRFRMTRMIRHINGFMRSHDASVPQVRVAAEDLTLLGDYLGKEYAYFTEPGCGAVEDMMDLEGIPLDPTYTGKALAGGLDWLKRNGEQDKTVLFWNTYNSVDLSGLCADVDYRALPRGFHKYFTEPTQEELVARGSPASRS